VFLGIPPDPPPRGSLRSDLRMTDHTSRVGLGSRKGIQASKRIFSFDRAWPHPNDLLVDDSALPVTYEGPSCPNKNSATAVMELYRRQCAERSEKTGVRGTRSGGFSPRKGALQAKLCTTIGAKWSKCCSYDWMFSSFGAFSRDRLCKVV
jgi:hypothetical protein